MTALELYIKTYFGAIQADELDKISSLFKRISLKSGESLLQAGRRCNQLAFVQKGMLRMFTLVDGKEVTQWISTPGYFATDLSSFIYENPSRWTIQALVDTEAFSISKDDYQRIGELVPRWAELEKSFLIKCFTTLEERIFSHLSMTAEERYESFFKSNRNLFNQVPLQYIASLLGMTPETLSRIRKKQLL